MHPQIRQNKPGKCPICGMDLIPLKTSGSGDEAVDPSAIQLSKEAVALANIQTTVISRQNPIKDVRCMAQYKLMNDCLNHKHPMLVGGLKTLYQLHRREC